MKERHKVVLSVVAELLKQIDEQGKQGCIMGFIMADREGPFYLAMPHHNEEHARQILEGCQICIVACAKGIETGMEIKEDVVTKIQDIFKSSEN